MKRSERYQRRATNGILLGILSITIGAAISVWCYVAALSMGDWAFLSAIGHLTAMVFIVTGFSFFREAARDSSAARRERSWEFEREIRPRL